MPVRKRRSGITEIGQAFGQLCSYRRAAAGRDPGRRTPSKSASAEGRRTHSILMFASVTTLRHLSVSALITAFSLSGGISMSSPPRVASRGFISGAAALVAASLSPQVKPYLIASHQSVEEGHRMILDHLGLKPLLNLGLRLGEGTGAALGISLVEASLKILDEMTTFSEAGVSEKENSHRL